MLTAAGGLEGLGYAGNCATSDGLMHFANALWRSRSLTTSASSEESGCEREDAADSCEEGGGGVRKKRRLRRLDLRGNDAGAKAALAFSKVRVSFYDTLFVCLLHALSLCTSRRQRCSRAQ
jgi:hypothetical protein